MLGKNSEICGIKQTASVTTIKISRYGRMLLLTCIMVRLRIPMVAYRFRPNGGVI